MFSAMWSEHCSYKSSRIHLKNYPRPVARRPGTRRNAGGLSISATASARLQMESHNHPSFIEPYQGAATGVGNSSRYFYNGRQADRSVELAAIRRPGQYEYSPSSKGVVSGIAGYGMIAWGADGRR